MTWNLKNGLEPTGEFIAQNKALLFVSTIVILALQLSFGQLSAQGVAINNTNSAPDASAMLDVQSNNKGILIPRMSSAQRDAISTPATGLLVFDTDSNSFYFYTGTVWDALTTTTSIVDTDDQTVDVFNLSGTTLELSLEDDGVATNSIDLSSIDTDDQTLSIDNTNADLSIADGNTVEIKTIADSDDDTRIMVESFNDEDKIRFNIGGTEALIIDDQQQIGIGTSNPLFDLHLEYTSSSNYYPLMFKNRSNVSGNLNLIGFVSAPGPDSAKVAIGYERTSSWGRGSLHFLTRNSPNNSAASSSDIRMTINMNGNVGIGETNPSALLHVNGTFRLSDGSQQNGHVLVSNGSGDGSWQSPSTVFTDTDDQTIDVFNLSGTTLQLSLEDDGVATNSVDLSSINTDDQTLSYDNSNADLSITDGNTVEIKTIADSDDDTKIQVEESADEDIIRLDIEGFEAVRIDSGDIHLNIMPGFETEGILRLGRLQNFDRDHLIKAYNSTTTADNYLTFALHNGTSNSTNDILTLKGNGNIGIGTISPNEALEVNGSIRMTDGNQGANKVMVSDANGTGSWQPPASVFTDTDDQTVDIFNLSGTTLQLSLEDDGMATNSVNLSSINTDDQAIDVFNLSGTTLQLSLENDGVATYNVDLSSINPDDQTLSFNNTNADLTIADGNTVEIKTIADSDDDTRVRVEHSTDEDKIRFVTGGTEAMIIDEQQQIGIGTSNPRYDLQLEYSSSGTYFPQMFKNTSNTNGNLNLVGFISAPGLDSAKAAIGYERTHNWGRGSLHFLTNNTSNSSSVSSSDIRMTIDKSGSVGINTTAPGSRFEVGTNGDGTAARANAWNIFSDRRWKTNIISIPDPLEKLSQINGYYYHWIETKDTTQQVGVIAQEIEAVLPQCVYTDDKGYKSVDYGKLTALLIEVSKSQQQEIEQLKTEHEAIKTRLADYQHLEERIAQLESLVSHK